MRPAVILATTSSTSEGSSAISACASSTFRASPPARRPRSFSSADTCCSADRVRAISASAPAWVAPSGGSGNGSGIRFTGPTATVLPTPIPVSRICLPPR